MSHNLSRHSYSTPALPHLIWCDLLTFACNRLDLAGIKLRFFPISMDKYPTLNLPPVHLRAIRRRGSTYIWDGLRGSWLLLTPEEWVRRHVIGWLTDHLRLLPTSIVQEYPLAIGGTTQRADIVVLRPDMNAALLVECKAADVTINADVLNQAVRYNSIVRAPFIMLTNGMRHYFYSTEDRVTYTPLDTLPDIASLV